MLPAKGYLKSINCPFFETCICERPYCHYKHNKKDIITMNGINTDLISEIVTKAVHKVLLQENRTTTTTTSSSSTSSSNANVTYNPTPISQLNKYKNENIAQIKKHIPIIQYMPDVPSLIINENDDDVVPNYNDEFIDEFLNDPNIYEETNNTTDVSDDDSDVSDNSVESTLDECKRIFEEYKVPICTSTSTATLIPLKIDSVIMPLVKQKKRIAYKQVEKEKMKKATTTTTTRTRTRRIKNPALVMVDRYKNKNYLKRPSERSNEYIGTCKRIASVPNVSALLDAKKSIGCESDVCVADDVPTVRHAEKSKLPVNIRSRFLFLIVKECLQLYISKEDAYERALNEEFNCYTKCTAIHSYKNTVMLMINRLRKDNTALTPKHNVSQFDESQLYEHFHKWILTDEELFDNGFPRQGAPSAKGRAVFKKNKLLVNVPANYQQCARCKKLFQIKENGRPVYQEDCIYHPYNRILIKGEEAKYSCCQQISLRKGCCICDTHVFEITNPEKLMGFVSTFAPEPEPTIINSRKIYALDCEMVYTTRGLELGRITVVDTECNVSYESLVKPVGMILDYNTRFSGLTPDILENVRTTITDVQATLLLMFNSDTILVGHSFESDLKALRLIHNCVVDTSLLFPHKMGPPKKRALRTLASEYLQKIIQNDDDSRGHDSAEDAITCMELLIWKLKDQLKKTR